MLQFPLRLLAAFVIGWLVAYLNLIGVFVNAIVGIGGMGTGVVIPLLALLLPVLVGVVVSLLNMDRYKRGFIPLSSASGICAIAGWYVYWIPQMQRLDAECVSCGTHGPGYTNTGILFTFWVIGAALVLVSALISSLIMHFVLKRRSARIYPNSANTGR